MGDFCLFGCFSIVVVFFSIVMDVRMPLAASVSVLWGCFLFVCLFVF